MCSTAVHSCIVTHVFYWSSILLATVHIQKLTHVFYCCSLLHCNPCVLLVFYLTCNSAHSEINPCVLLVFYLTCNSAHSVLSLSSSCCFEVSSSDKLLTLCWEAPVQKLQQCSKSYCINTQNKAQFGRTQT